MEKKKKRKRKRKRMKKKFSKMGRRISYWLNMKREISKEKERRLIIRTTLRSFDSHRAQ